MGKNGYGEGDIRQRPDGRWEACWHVDTPTGLKTRSVYGMTCKNVTKKLTTKLANKLIFSRLMNDIEYPRAPRYCADHLTT